MTSASVTSIYGGPSGERTPDPEAIRALSEMLERAQAGEIIGVGIVALGHDGMAVYQLCGKVGSFCMVGAAHMLAHDLAEEIAQ